MTVEGDLVASAMGVPPKWVDTIQGAELWAILMALQSVTFPKGLYTDCDSVRVGFTRGGRWAGSSKRRYARVWTSLYAIVDEGEQWVHWIPAHTSEASIDSAVCSDGSVVDETKWCANKMVDHLAKDAAETVRVPVQVRSRLLHRELQLREFSIYLGKLTHAANSFQGPDGVVRDSDSKRPQGRKVNKTRSSTKSVRPKSFVGVVRRAASKTGTKSSWCMPASCTRMHSKRHSLTAANALRSARAKAAIDARLEASFVESWRERRAATLKPSEGPSASERMNALKQRIAARNAAS